MKRQSEARWIFLGLLAQSACLGDGPGNVTDPNRTNEVPAAAAAWLSRNVVPFQTVDPAESLNELEPLRAIVGDAHVVALGEATHGTREFFRMKSRIVRFLVERMGFDAFAIEATWPEANRLDHYVRTGVGDPAALLSGLYFWTWNTEEVAEMIAWMREHNASGGSVGFYGFDMQYPGMAIDNVLEFIRKVDPAAEDTFQTRLRCLQQFSNGANGRFPSSSYGNQSAEYRTACSADLAWVHVELSQRRSAYESASSAAEYAVALRSARVAGQYEAMVSNRMTRDESMAENALWLKDQLGPDGKIVLWAHNGHLSRRPGAMGQYLDRELGPDHVNVAFSFSSGIFTAVTQSGTSFLGLAVHAADRNVALSYPAYFSQSGHPQFLLHLRKPGMSSDSSAWLYGPRPFRSIGCCYDPGNPLRYWYNAVLPQEFDIVIHFETTLQSRVLPFRYPPSF
jgi:erythromycin esterase